MRSPRSKNSRARERAVQIERAFLGDLLWLAFLVALAILFLPLTTHAGDYQSHEMKLRKYEVEIEKHELEIRAMAKEKASTSDGREKERLHEAMVAEHSELEKISAKYNDEKVHLRFKHPEKGENKERQYSRHTVQPLSAFEDVSLDGKLDTFLGKFKRVYGETPKPKKVEPKKSAREVASEKKEKAIDPDAMDQQLTLSK